MTRRDWYLGIAIVATALLIHALVPRYEWREGRRDRRGQEMIRIDRWTGASTVMILWAPPPPEPRFQ